MTTKEDHTKERLKQLEEIVVAIDHWLENWCKGNIDSRVGAAIQRHATREVSFLSYIQKVPVSMDELRIKANEEIRRLGGSVIPKPATLNWKSLLNIGKPTAKTRREELEDMSTSDLRELYFDKKAEELRQQRIEYILKSERDYGSE
jgi:hypothetical protein